MTDLRADDRAAATALRRSTEGRHIPRATYRIQLTPAFTFADAEQIVPQLAALGVSHLYLSPVLEAVEGSTHGYDVVDPARIRGELGGAAGLDRLARTAAAAGLGIVLDIVPNHVGLFSPANPWWWDTLRHGPEGRFGHHLDIRWTPGVHGQPTVLVPQLGAPLDEELTGGALHVEYRSEDEAPDRAGYRIVYHEHGWPVRPGTVAAVGLAESDVAASLAALGSDPALLEALLGRQHYRLVHWRRANDDLDYRRFFDVMTLGAVRIEDPEVFADAHRAILPRVADGTIEGLRIDHPDGLLDPVGYFRDLRDAVGPAAWIVVEKVLERGEERRTDWPVDGTVGYAIADLLLGLHVDAAAGPILDALQAELTGGPLDRATLIETSQRAALHRLFGAERQWVTNELLAAAPDLDRGLAHDGLVELLVAWPVYRTYVRPGEDGVDDPDRSVIQHAIRTAGSRRPDLRDVIERVGRLLLLEDRSDPADRFLWTFQQLTGPVIAKGLEDTVLYRDLRFVAVNEVGGHPGELGRSIEELHADAAHRQRDWPATMVLSSTHDTKRSHDVRARLATLSQDATQWADLVRHWTRLASRHRGRHGPSPAHEHLLFQTLVGTWPISEQRLHDYLIKAAREGKERTDWIDTDTDYERDLEDYASAVLRDAELAPRIEAFVASIAESGWLTSLSMQAMALTTPGVPDIYQGSELWDLSLVDPDNRRPVDHARRAALLTELTGDGAPDPAGLLDRLDEGLPKLWLIHRALGVRRSHPAAFGPDADYLPLMPTGHRAFNVVAYLRGSQVLTVAPRQVRALGESYGTWDWGATDLTIPPGTWRDALTDHVVEGEQASVADLLGAFPVAILVRDEHPDMAG